MSSSPEILSPLSPSLSSSPTTPPSRRHRQSRHLSSEAEPGAPHALLLQTNRPHPLITNDLDDFSYSPSQYSPYPPPSQRFSHLLTTVLGSPFLTTSDPDHSPPELDLIDATATAVPHNFAATRPSSPTPTADFSIIGYDEFDGQPPNVFSVYGSFPSRRGLSSRASRFYSSIAPSLSAPCIPPSSSYPPSHSSPLRSFLPRIWDVLSSPSRGVLHFSGSNYSGTYPSSPTASPLRSKCKARMSVSLSSPLPVNLPRWSSVDVNDPYGELSDLEPLDGEEGELIDDEGCFFGHWEVRAVTGMDILRLLPMELSIQVLSLLNTAEDLPSIIACLGVSRTWNALGSDNSVWRALFLGRWSIDLRKAQARRVPRERRDGVSVSPPPLDFRRCHPTSSRVRKSSLKALAPLQIAPLQPSPRQLHTSERQLKKRSFSLGPESMRMDAGSRFGAVDRLPECEVWEKSDQVAQLHRPALLRAQSRKRRASTSSVATTHTLVTPSKSPLVIDWKSLYQVRLELDRRWEGVSSCLNSRQMLPSQLHHPFPLPYGHSVYPFGGSRGSPVDQPSISRNSVVMPTPTASEPFEPRMTKISGHTDSVYCLEFDSKRIITGSRDRTIKVWSLKTGKLLGTFWGVHRGSVLCLKFEGDWEDRDEDSNPEPVYGSRLSSDESSSSPLPHERNVHIERYPPNDELEPGMQRGKRGFMITGSSDCNICVWDVYTMSPSSTGSSGSRLITGEPQMGAKHDDEVRADVRAILKGHSGGVLDLRIDQRWIVSCSKDAVIRIWKRSDLTLHRTLRGHEGPVNAVGLQGNRIVSASGDGKMILWDIENGERLRTFEGHDRGLACIEFKHDLIVSGSNDCKIKVWSATTGECLKTLVGHEALVRALAFDPKSGRLVSASYDKSVKLWDIKTGKLVREFRNMHTSHIFDVKFDVARIVSTSHDQKIVVFDFSEGIDTSIF